MGHPALPPARRRQAPLRRRRFSLLRAAYASAFLRFCQDQARGGTISAMKKRFVLLAFLVLLLLLAGFFAFVRDAVSSSAKRGGALGAVSAAGAQKERGDCTLKPKPREFNAAPYYEGPLIDAHLHMPVSSGIVAAVGRRMGLEHMPAFGGGLTPDYLACLLKSEGIMRVFGFFHATRYNLGAEVRAARNFEKKYPGLIASFFMPGTNDALRVSTSTVQTTLDKNRGLFKGMGEIKMFDNGSMLRPVFLSHFDLARTYGIPVMLHPYEKHKTEVPELLKRYAEVKFLFHGGRDADWMVGHLGQFPNAYYSIDADMVGLYGSGGPREGRQKDPTKEEFIAYFRGHFNEVLRTALVEWKPRIEAHPHRFMWGTDRWYDWHFDVEVGGLLEEFGRAFIGHLAPEVQERFAYKNAEMFLSGR